MKRFWFLFTFLFAYAGINSIINANEGQVKYEMIYFHGTTRCEGCLAIEKFAQNSLNEYYEKELNDSTLLFKSMDFLLPENEHFQKDYKFDTQTIIVRKIVNGKVVKWKNFDKIWDYYSDYDKFKVYIKKEMSKFLKK